MKIRNEHDRRLIEELILREDGTFKSGDDEGVKNFIKRRTSIMDKVSPFGREKRKSWNAKRNWKQNRHKLEKGINQFHNSTKGKSFHRKLNRFNSDRLAAYGRVFSEEFTEESFLTALLSLQTHLIIESQYIIPDLETHLSSKAMIDTAMDILEGITWKIRRHEELDEIELEVLRDLTI